MRALRDWWFERVRDYANRYTLIIESGDSSKRWKFVPVIETPLGDLMMLVRTGVWEPIDLWGALRVRIERRKEKR